MIYKQDKMTHDNIPRLAALRITEPWEISEQRGLPATWLLLSVLWERCKQLCEIMAKYDPDELFYGTTVVGLEG